MHASEQTQRGEGLMIAERGAGGRRHGRRGVFSGALLCAIGLTFMLVTSAPGASARTQGIVRQLDGTPTPAGDTLLRRSLTAMESSLRASHTSGRITVTMGKQTSKSTVTGDCLMNADGSFAARFRSRGSAVVNGKVRSIDTRYVLIPSKQKGRVWKRSGKNRWKRADSDQGALLYLLICPREGARQYVGTLSSGATLTNLGSVDVKGVHTWHLQNSQQGSAVDMYIDQTSLYLVRARAEQKGAGFHQRTGFDYARFNRMVTITPPK